MAIKDDDDFVFTLSDDDTPINEEELEEDDAFGKDTSAAKKNGSKRKRDASETATGASKKKLKKQQNKKGKKAAPESDDEEEDAESENEELKGEDDGALDPDFEFDVGGAAQKGQVEEFDGWGAEERHESTSGNKKGVDIDEIIARRNQKRLEKEKKQNRKNKTSSDDEESGSEGDDNDFAGFDDNDELLADDAFGMGAGEESESEQEDKPQDVSDDEGSSSEEENDGDRNDDSDSDSDDSVAAPMPHPDDLRSDSSDSEEEDAEEAEKAKAFYAPEDKTAKSDSTFDSFQSFSLSRPIIRGLTSIGFTAPTPIQQKAIPVALLGKDIVGGAVTGSGKTAAFLVPILERLLYRPKKVATSRVAILMPTRELAVQCYNVGTKLATFTDITFCQVVGGFSLREQENILKKRPDVIIATPGRFIDHMRNSASFTVDTLEILVLDEADRMLEDGFADELNEILTTIPKTRQTMLFSATMTSSIDKLINVGLNKPVRLMVDAKKQTVTTLTQEFVRLRPGREDKRLAYLLLLCENVYKNRVIIFFRQKKEAHRVRIVFGLFGLKAAELHGSMSQEQVC